MVRSRARSPSQSRDPADAPSAKKLKSKHVSSTSTLKTLQDPIPHFADGLLGPQNVQKLHQEYATSEPYKYCKVEKLFQDDLLVEVKDECLSQLSFTEKETDIYKVNQTGDLASLNYLTADQIALFPNLLTLRDALYSPNFRSFLQSVTGCGALSGTKQDMSVNSYTKGCHLLNHDDVIGSRRVSYILYMPLPYTEGWKAEWGGALELYPIKIAADGIPEPEPVPSKSIPPSWNQFIFFEVQPGRSFHSVEEVVVGDEEDGRQRLSISGWFHAAQPGEEGYDPDEKAGEFKSSREQLASTSTDFKTYSDDDEPPLPSESLSAEHTSFLSEFLNPIYLQPRTMQSLGKRFVDESSLELHSFLSEPLATKLAQGLVASDARDGLGPNRAKHIPAHTAGTNLDESTPGIPWTIKGPPHKWRYCTLGSQPGDEAAVPLSAQTSPDAIIRTLQDELFPSSAFRAWLANVSSMLPLRWDAQARRFRPGLDYTLATSEENEARLDVVLGLTPDVTAEETDKKSGKRKKVEPEEAGEGGWQSGEWGGWECYMAPHEGEDDPAVYRSGSSKKRADPPPPPAKDAKGRANKDEARASGSGDGKGKGRRAASTSSDETMHTEEDGDEGEGENEGDDDDEEEDDDDDDEDDGTLLTVQPGFNRLLLVLRDEGVMRFVKYVSAAAQGSRWDVCAEYEVGMIEEDE
ncbi:nuclear protein [Trametopsis cervina]|nr:nuclear protein [Trametopsis cervina]